MMLPVYPKESCEKRDRASLRVLLCADCAALQGSMFPAENLDFRATNAEENCFRMGKRLQSWFSYLRHPCTKLSEWNDHKRIRTAHFRVVELSRDWPEEVGSLNTVVWLRAFRLFVQCVNPHVPCWVSDLTGLDQVGLIITLLPLCWSSNAHQALHLHVQMEFAIAGRTHTHAFCRKLSGIELFK